MALNLYTVGKTLQTSGRLRNSFENAEVMKESRHKLCETDQCRILQGTECRETSNHRDESISKWVNRTVKSLTERTEGNRFS